MCLPVNAHVRIYASMCIKGVTAVLLFLVSNTIRREISRSTHFTHVCMCLLLISSQQVCAPVQMVCACANSACVCGNLLEHVFVRVCVSFYWFVLGYVCEHMCVCGIWACM